MPPKSSGMNRSGNRMTIDYRLFAAQPGCADWVVSSEKCQTRADAGFRERGSCARRVRKADEDSRASRSGASLVIVERVPRCPIESTVVVDIPPARRAGDQ